MRSNEQHEADTVFPETSAISAGRRSFGRDDSGTTAVEFGLIAAPFFALMFAIIQIGLIFFSGQVLDNATTEAARLIRTGQAQASGYTAADFKSAICLSSGTLFDCQSNLKVDVRTYADFNATDMSKPIDKGELDDKNFTFQMGGREDIVVVRAFYEWPVWVPLMAVPHGNGVKLGDLANGNFMLTSAITFRNEPF
ncbi:TadE/TadG family type IV pilus assembly protein [Tepidamorphus sp. 3E244]|uniref:TadE/TadG family type IV pilus assembly protein n=1 Tax=Tepidamorphus sp. 3E244 TaxID=3385498 RepID=UPI0038FC62A4